MTCERRFASLGLEDIDAQTYAEWGVDYLSEHPSRSHHLGVITIVMKEYDNCYNEGLAGTPKISYDRFNNMSKALNATGRPILYSMCNWGEDGPWNFAPVSDQNELTSQGQRRILTYVHSARKYRLLQTAGVFPEIFTT